MTTWHQKQNPQQLWHETLYTVVYDRANEMLAVERFRDPVDAQRAADRVEGAYVLPPAVKHKEMM